MSSASLTKRSRTVCLLLAPLLCSAPARPQAAGYWHTSGERILDQANQPVRIAAVNWYGLETEAAVPGGLTSQDYKTILSTIASLGFNTVRLPFSNQAIEHPSTNLHIAFNNASGPINGDLKGLNSLEVMDRIVAAAGALHLRVILDNHRSEAGPTAEANGLWFTPEYPESAWIADWVGLVKRYRNNPTVVGVDLRNEPHSVSGAGACWDCGGANDWHLAAQRAGNAVLAVNPKLIVVVEGVDLYNGDYTWWGGNLEGVQRSPVKLAVANQLVYSAHEYGPHESKQSWFDANTTPASLGAVWTKHWAYIAQQKIAPVWVGEFGTPNAPTDVASSVPGSQGQWFQSFVAYLAANPAVNWGYWALNGEDTYGLLDPGYRAPANAAKQVALNSLLGGPMALAAAPVAATGRACHVNYQIQKDWGTGFVGILAITNTGSVAISGWHLSWSFAAGETITQSWNGTFAQNGAEVSVTNLGWNGTIAPGATVAEIGFQASRSGTNPTPAVFLLNGVACR
jgi:endoglucanase